MSGVTVSASIRSSLVANSRAASANICCGAHAGSPEHSLETALICRKLGVQIGAHPGYPDREHFGRRSWSELPSDIRNNFKESLKTQLDHMVEFALYVKPHGALYNDCTQPCESAEILTEVLSESGLMLMGLPSTHHQTIARDAGVLFIREGFADRKYTDQGTLVSRKEPDAILTEPVEVCKQAERLAVEVDSLCLHGDTPGAVAFADQLFQHLQSAGFEIAPFRPGGR